MYKGILIFAISFLIMKPMLVLETKNDKDNYLIKNQSYETSNDTVTINGIRSSVRFINAHGDIKNNVTTKSYCVGEWQGGGAYSWNNFFTGSEYYAVYQDMYLSGCYDIFPFNVTEIEWYLYGRVDNITIEVQPLIYEADYSDPNCLKPGEIFFAGPVYEVNLPSSGGYILGLPFLEPACVNGPYFAGIYISTYLGSGIIEVVIDDETAIECKSYNYYTEEFLDLVTAYGITGNLELWSVGYSSDQNECQPLFTTTVINTMPLVNFSNIPIYTQIDAIFDSSMNPSTINNSTFIVHASQTGLHTGIISYDEPSKTATFDPAVDFAPGEVVTVTLTDAIESTDGISLKPYSWSFTIENEEGGMDFLISDTISTGDGAHSVYLADYNNDGNFDIAVANPYSNNVSVILNNGNAEFGPQSTYGVGEVPYWITSADLNGDGYIDIATANNTTQDVSILLNNGDGTFGTSIEYSVGATTRGLTAADFDNDGDMDLVSANETVSFVSFLLNNGDGTFQSYRSWRTGISPLSVTAGDFDNDGDIDIVSANKDDYNTSVLFNDGTGIFTLSANYSIGNHVRCVTNADLNGDGFLDLITANADDDNISVLMNNSDGTFADRVNYAVGDRPITVFPCDIDGDGDQDLLTANDLSNDVSILLNNGNGTFASQTTVPSGSEPHAIFAGDLTNDGDLDFVVANWNGDNIMIYLNERRPRIAGSSPNQNDLNIIPSTEINLTLDTTMSSSTFSNSTLIVHASQTGLHSGTISYDEPTKTATFEPDEDFAPGEIVTVTLTDGIESTEGVPLKPYTWSFTIEAEEAPAEFEIIEEYATFNAPHDAVPVDYDNDGDMDIWVACLDDSEDNLSIYLNDGNGFFTPGSTYVVYDGTGSLAFADFNGDGFTDLVANKGKQVVLGYGNGDGTGYAGPVLSCWEGDPQSGVYQVITSDFNSDGHADIATCNATTTDISIILNNGDGTFEGAVQYPVANFPVSITYGDIDNDGDIDIAVANHFDDKITIHRNNGDGTFANYVEYITSQGPYSIKMADLNGDQYLDITCGHGSSVSTDTVTVMMNNGDGTFANYQTINVGNAPLKVNTGDMDGDGDIDIIVANADGTSIQILENDGIANFSPGTTYTTGSFPISPYPADLDNDGDLDIVTANRDSDNISILFNEICTDSDGDHFGDPGYPENTCATDNCPSVFNPDQEDYDLDGIGDSCDPCNNFMFELTKFDTLNVKVTEPVIFYPEVTDPDDTEFYLTYNIIPTWATIQNDTLYGTPPGDTIVYYDTVSFSIMDACNIDSLTFTTMAFLCGNINGDSRLNILDITYLIAYLYKNGDEPEPLVAADINDSGNINILDITYLIAYLYKSGPAPVCQE